MRLSIFSVSLPEWSPEEALAKLKPLGYEGVEWRITDQKESADGKPGFWAGNRCTWPISSFVEDAPRIKSLVEKAGLEMPCLGTYAGVDDLANVEKGMKGAQILGVKKLRVGTRGYDGTKPFWPQFDEAVALFRKVEAMAKDHGVQALVEMHMNMIVPSASAARRFVEHFDPKYVGVIYDSGNVVYEGYEQYRMALEMLGPWLAHVHVKNARWAQKDDKDGAGFWVPEWAPLSRGVAHLPTFLRILKDFGYDGWVTVEDFSTHAPMEDRLRENAVFLKKLL